MTIFFEKHLRNMDIPFSQSDIDLLLDNSTLVYYKKGTKFVTQGEDCLYACFLLSGIMSRFYMQEDVEYTVSYFSKEEWVGDYYSFINEIPAAFYIEAVVDCSAMLLKKNRLS